MSAYVPFWDGEPVVWEDVESSAIACLGYSRKTNKLFVCFQRGFMYVYHAVPHELFMQVFCAQSCGKALTRSRRSGRRTNVLSSTVG